MKLLLKEVFFMNNKGQSLVAFVLILPIIVFFIAYFIDSISGIMNKSRLEGIIKNNLEIVVKDNIQEEEKIVNVLKENEENINVQINITENEIRINTISKIKYLFGNIFHRKEDELKLTYCGNYQDKKIYKCNE